MRFRGKPITAHRWPENPTMESREQLQRVFPNFEFKFVALSASGVYLVEEPGETKGVVINDLLIRPGEWLLRCDDKFYKMSDSDFRIRYMPIGCKKHMKDEPFCGCGTCECYNGQNYEDLTLCPDYEPNLMCYKHLEGDL